MLGTAAQEWRQDGCKEEGIGPGAREKKTRKGKKKTMRERRYLEIIDRGVRFGC